MYEDGAPSNAPSAVVNLLIVSSKVSLTELVFQPIGNKGIKQWVQTIFLRNRSVNRPTELVYAMESCLPAL